MSEAALPGTDVPHYHTVGIGAGPANLSLAALFESATTETIALFDSQPDAGWHNRLLHSGVRMQTSWLKDLVSLVDARHELTFLNYLVTTGRMFAFMNSQFDFMPRTEYVRYLSWAASKLRHVHYGVRIDQITLGDNGFALFSAGRPVGTGEHLVIGMGSRPFIPAEFVGLPADRAFIADDLAERIGDLGADTGAPVAVAGGGQTGIEAVMFLLGKGFTNIKWFGRRLWFETIDDSPTANDVYRPAHMQALQRLSPATRRRIIERLNPTGDALTPGAVRALYQANYDAMLVTGHFPVTMFPGRDVHSGVLDQAGDGSDEIVLHCRTPEKPEQHRVRHLVIATGRENTPVPFDDELGERIEIGEDGELIVEPDFSVRWKGMNGHQIYALNRSRLGHGLTDANLTLLPVRAAIVLNSMFGREMFEIRDELCPVNWG
ncbi:MAG TPA: SidA/IucD/PvdA family monooxygenase [Actinophytocola sp.]|jgi:lysine N6-hydroxylase|uniref:SidA/IucD/PvdA family monooxygenase n=1 Tax=Actinophytocola sp. TaxID=1872138 RepID=UPI002E0C1DC1|nr:SidA/IucD/PvdA family monooxygenase [Actinophytocola sp.]